ncbi:glycosyltransferase [Microbacterium sp. W4I20]|uniref:glycosyltransferase n=1 Tax=Microbacterium sp. W4I20 TaxID=3042262 RepID=UPI002782A263|nr:glycosyltransferase [Microbacterium sp. W4I20]MDQ0726309.1 glycosyltransferase involved in cell wall biosynthesis [Microbacterium sp. W4I20]
MTESSGAEARPETVLIVSLAGIRYATRPRKAARELARSYRVRYLALQSSGRGGRVDEAGVFDSDGIAVHQVRVRPRRPGGGIAAKLFNLLVSYLPAFIRLFWVAAKTPAAVILIANPVLAPIALVHRARFRSQVVLDVAERPGAIAARDSLASIFSRLEPLTLGSLARRDAIATVAVPSDANDLRTVGFRTVLPLRNVPLSSWRAPYVAPVGDDELRCVVIGSVFEGRAYEILIEAMALCAQKDVRVRLRIVGPGTDQYLQQLHSLTEERGASDVITWSGAIQGDEVSRTYLDSHVGLVLYEPDDPGNDGLSNKILECVSSGRPVLAGDLPENRLFVTEHRVGWLTQVTAESIADALIRIRAEADLSEISERCRALGDSSLTWEADFAAVAQALSKAP